MATVGESGRRAAKSEETLAPYRFARLRPLADLAAIRIGPGFWAERRRVNRHVSLGHALRQFEASGNLGNLRVAAGGPGTHRPTLTLDADVYKWQEAIAWELASNPDAGLEEMLRRSVDLILSAQRDDGYVNSWFQVVEPERVFTDLTRGCELYCAGHMIEAAVAVSRSTNDERYLAAARRFADRIEQEFGPDGREGVDGHEEIELALIALYRATGEGRYLALAKRFVDLRGRGLVGPGVFGPRYYQDHEPVRAASTVTGHAVRAMYLNAAATDVYIETGDASLIDAMERQWTSMTTQKMHVTGGIGTRERDEAIGEPYELPPDRSYCETCAAAGLLFWNWRMLLATGERRYADMFERVLYNSFLAGVGLDGASFFYANPLEVRTEHEPPHESTWAGETPWYLSPAPEQATNRRRTWFPCACCPPNVMRVLSSLPTYVATRDADGVQLHQYVAGRYDISLEDGRRVAFDVSTAYPWEGEIRLEIVSSPDSPWSMSIRIPGWSSSSRVDVNGAAAEANADYAGIRRSWQARDVVTLSLGLEPRFVLPPRRVSALAGTAAIERGPLVYCVESPDNPGLNLADARVHLRSPLNTVFSTELGGIVSVSVEADYEPDVRSEWPYSDAAIGETVGTRRVDLTAIPYFLWANREPSSMRVWIPVLDDRSRP
jgi:DUF1680 family protein